MTSIRKRSGLLPNLRYRALACVRVTKLRPIEIIRKHAQCLQRLGVQSVPSWQTLIMGSPGSILSFLLFCVICDFSVCGEPPCERGKFDCKNGKCIEMKYMCDGYFDCTNGVDENDCFFEARDPSDPSVECVPPAWYRCSSGRCIASLFVCDGDPDCPQHDDERNCTSSSSGELACGDDHFACLNKKACIPGHWICDGQPDCDDASDETAGCKEKMKCEGGFRCANGHCIMKEFECDGDDDCHDNSDELKCDVNLHNPKNCHAEEGRFLCHDKVACLDLDHVCDNFTHCFDGSDEIGCDKAASCDTLKCSFGCRKTPDGPKCFCPPGFRIGSDLLSCEDVNECNIFGTCGQRCTNTNGSFTCHCDEGYELTIDKKSCVTQGGEALLLFASDSQIRGMYLGSNIYFPIAQSLHQVTAVSHNGHHVFWANINLGEEAIFMSDESGSNRKVVIDEGLGLPEDLEVDYVTGNIYFTDSEKKHIGVCTADGHQCAVLVNEDIDQPRAIVLLPRFGKMFWSDWGKRPMIATSGMDGSYPKPFLEDDIHWPNGLALDITNDRLYWVDAKLHEISSVKLDGSDRQSVLKTESFHPFSIAIFEDFLYFSDWDAKEVQKCHKFNGKNLTVLFKEKKDVYGVHIYHPLLHPRVFNPCTYAPCRGICLLAPNRTYTCACSEDMDLAPDNYTCIQRPDSNQIALVSRQDSYLVTKPVLGKNHAPKLSLPMYVTAAVIEYNSLTHALLIADSVEKKIWQYDLMTKSVSTLLPSGVGDVISMSHDPLTNNLYICDNERRSLDVWSLHTHKRKMVTKYSSGYRPKNVVVAPNLRVVFVAVVLPSEDIQIDQVRIDGSDQKSTLVSSSIMGSNVHLSYDIFQSTLYWVNPFFRAVESIHFTGKNRDVHHTFQADPTGFAVINSSIFYTSEHEPRLYHWSKLTDEHHLSLDISWGESFIMAVVMNRTNITHVCQKPSNGECSDICLAEEDSHVCVCADGARIAKNGWQCLTNLECDESSYKCHSDGSCIPKMFRCDKHPDCPSGEDEEDCGLKCVDGNFKCDNGQCVASHKRCDYSFDCADRSDENNCTRHCREGQFQCGSGECISELWVCDLDEDCKDGSDEKDQCPASTCSKGKFRCHTGTCIYASWVCDGERDCIDGSDEYSCDYTKCKDNEWQCHNNLCVSVNLRCNGYNDCGDNSDEINCTSSTFQCPDGQFLCSTVDIMCLPNEARCNFTRECPRGEDEEHCARCRYDEFTCRNRKCVNKRWLCDGEDDCGDKSDEAQCSSKTDHLYLPCFGFRCKSGECVDVEKTCDGFEHCGDGSDEGGNCTNSCSAALCEGPCQATPDHAICKCNDGFKLGNDGHSCHDIDECLEDRCSQRCVNTVGSFLCACTDDYLLKNDRTTCKAKGDKMSYIIVGEDEIKKVSWDFFHLEELLYDPGMSIQGLDVDSRKKLVYWSSTGTSISLNVLKLEDGSRSFMTGVSRPGKLSLDWLTSNVFVIDKGSPNQIVACAVVAHKCVSVMSVEEGALIADLVFDPITGYLFYAKTIKSGLRRPYSKIFRYDIATKNTTQLTANDVALVSGMTVDHVRSELYWSDLQQEIVERIGFDGKHRQIVFKTEVRRPQSLTIFEDSLFWINKGSGEMTKCDVYGEHKGSCKTHSIHQYSALELVIHQAARQPLVHNGCANKTCGYNSLCLITPGGAKCVCEDGSTSADGEDCLANNEVSATFARAHVLPAHNSAGRYSGTSVFLAVFLTLLSMLGVVAGYVYLQRKRTVPLVLESFSFRNPTFGVSHMESDMHHRLLSPGLHEYINHSAFVQHPNGNVDLATPQRSFLGDPDFDSTPECGHTVKQKVPVRRVTSPYSIGTDPNDSSGYTVPFKPEPVRRVIPIGAVSESDSETTSQSGHYEDVDDMKVSLIS